MATSRARRPTAPRAARPPISRDAELEALAKRCTRFLVGDGPRRAVGTARHHPGRRRDRLLRRRAARSTDARDARSPLARQAGGALRPDGHHGPAGGAARPRRPTGSSNVAFHPTCHLDGWAEERGLPGPSRALRHPRRGARRAAHARRLDGVHQPLAVLLARAAAACPRRHAPDAGPSSSPRCDGRRSAVRPSTSTARGSGRRRPSTHGRAASRCATSRRLFDTIYVSFYKGLGGPRRVLRRRRSRRDRRALGVADTPRRARLHDVALCRVGAHRPRPAPSADDEVRAPCHRHRPCASRTVPGVEVLPEPPQSAMLHVRLSTSLEGLRAGAMRIARKERVWTFARPFATEGPRLQRCELSVGDATLELSAREIAELLGQLATG